MRLSRRLLVRSIMSFGLIGLLVLTAAVSQSRIAKAQTTLSINMITWSIMGQDAADPNAGPNEYPVGVRVCNTGAASNDPITVTFEFTGDVDADFTLINPDPITLNALGEAACDDAYFWVRLARSAAAVDSTRDVRITASVGSVSVNATQTLKIVAMNAVGDTQTASITGPESVRVGQPATYRVTATTTAAGYPEFQHFVNFCPSNFTIDTVTTSYTLPTGANSDLLWADRCEWKADNSGCANANVENGGGTITYNVVVRAIASGSCRLRSTIIAFNGSQFHYNNDFGADSLDVQIIAAQVTPTLTPRPPTSTPTRTPGPSPTPTGTPTPGPSPTPTITPIGGPVLPGTGSRLHPAQMLPSADPAAPASPTQIGITIAVIITLVFGVAFAAWAIMMNYGLIPKKAVISKRVFGALGVMFMVCALVLAGMLALNLIRATTINAPPDPQAGLQSEGVEVYRPPDIPATHLIIPVLNINTELTEAPRLGNSWDVSQFFKEIAHLEGTAYPGTPGNAILAGHVNTERGSGPFHNLETLLPGQIIIARGEGVEYRYKVDWVQIVEPEAAEVLLPTDESVLTLISCAEWSDETWSYEKRIVVRAKFFDRATIDPATPTPTEEGTSEPTDEGSDDDA